MLAAAVMAVLVVLAVGGGYVGAAVSARHRAQAVADLAALAAAGRVAAGPQAACVSASAVAARSGAAVSSCTVAELDVIVGVEVSVDLGRWGVRRVGAQARAGPAG